MEFEDETSRPPSGIEVADLESRRKEIRDSRFFEIRTPQYPDCSHMWRGITLHVGTRKVFCKCGEQIDPFDALLLYARAETRLESTRSRIEEHERKEAEKKARRPFFRRHVGFAARYDTNRHLVGYTMNLECGHQGVWMVRGVRRSAPRGMTCEQCVREDKLKAQGVNVLKAVHP